jgi:hypothetical protein
LIIIDMADAELLFDCGNGRRTLVEFAGQELNGFRERGIVDRIMEAKDSDILLACVLLRLRNACGSFNTDDEAACDFRIESAGMAGFLDIENPFHPGNDLVGGGVGRFVEVEDTVFEQIAKRTLVRGVATGEWGEEAATTQEVAEILEKEGPFGGVGDVRLGSGRELVGFVLGHWGGQLTRSVRLLWLTTEQCKEGLCSRFTCRDANCIVVHANECMAEYVDAVD